jgi:hydrogenase-4 membrane subunit HyfE
MYVLWTSISHKWPWRFVRKTLFTIVVFECMGWQVVIRGIFIMCIIVLLCQSVLVKNLMFYQLIHVSVNEKNKRCWVGLFKCGMHALNVSCVTHPLWKFVMLRWTFVMHELYVPSDKSMCMYCMVVGCCLPWQKFMKDKKTLYTIFIAIGIFNYTLKYKGL